MSRVSTCCEHLAASRAGGWGEPWVSVWVLRLSAALPRPTLVWVRTGPSERLVRGGEGGPQPPSAHGNGTFSATQARELPSPRPQGLR